MKKMLIINVSAIIIVAIIIAIFSWLLNDYFEEFKDCPRGILGIGIVACSAALMFIITFFITIDLSSEVSGFYEKSLTVGLVSIVGLAIVAGFGAWGIFFISLPLRFKIFILFPFTLIFTCLALLFSSGEVEREKEYYEKGYCQIEKIYKKERKYMIITFITIPIYSAIFYFMPKFF